MSVIRIYPFDTPVNYTIAEPTKAEISGSSAKLILADNPESFAQDYSSDTGFTYDSNYTEFSGGQVQQKSLRIPNAVWGATYTDNIDASWADTNTVGTAIGGAAIASNKLDLKYSDVRYVSYAKPTIGNIFTIRFKYTPNYSGAPASTRAMFTIDRNNSTLLGAVTIWHASDSRLTGRVYDDSGLVISFFNSWSPTSGQTYEIEMNIDLVSGGSRLFVDGNLQAGPYASTGNAGTGLVRLAVGGYYQNAVSSNCEIEDFVIFDSIQHTANYTPGYTLLEYDYNGDIITLPSETYTGIGSVQSYIDATMTDSNTPHYVINSEYWDGAQWTSSDDSYAQSNTAADLNTNISTLTASDTTVVKIITDDSKDQMSVSNSVIGYNGQAYSASNPTVEIAETWFLEEFVNFVEASTKTGNDEIKYIFKKGTSWYWFDGVSWSVSDETYAQSNTAVEVVANLSTFTSSNISFGVRFFLHSDDGTTTPENNNLTISYDSGGFSPDTKFKCNVVFNIFDIVDTLPADKKVYASLNVRFAKYKTITGVSGERKSFDVEDDGNVEMELIENVNMADPTGNEATVKTVFEIGTYTGRGIVPEDAEANIFSILEAE